MRWQLVLASVLILPSFFAQTCFAFQDPIEVGLHIEGIGFLEVTAASPTAISASGQSPTGITAAATAEVSPFTNSLGALFGFSVSAQNSGGGGSSGISTRAAAVQYYSDTISLVGTDYSGDITVRFTVDGNLDAEVNRDENGDAGLFSNAGATFQARTLNIASAFPADIIAGSVGTSLFSNQFSGPNVASYQFAETRTGVVSSFENFENFNVSPNGEFVGAFDLQYSINSTTPTYEVGTIFGLVAGALDGSAVGDLGNTVGLEAVFDVDGNDLSEFVVFESGLTFSVPEPGSGATILFAAVSFGFYRRRS